MVLYYIFEGKDHRVSLGNVVCIIAPAATFMRAKTPLSDFRRRQLVLAKRTSVSRRWAKNKTTMGSVKGISKWSDIMLPNIVVVLLRVSPMLELLRHFSCRPWGLLQTMILADHEKKRTNIQSQWTCKQGDFTREISSIGRRRVKNFGTGHALTRKSHRARYNETTSSFPSARYHDSTSSPHDSR